MLIITIVSCDELQNLQSESTKSGVKPLQRYCLANICKGLPISNHKVKSGKNFTKLSAMNLNDPKIYQVRSDSNFSARQDHSIVCPQTFERVRKQEQDKVNDHSQMLCPPINCKALITVIVIITRRSIPIRLLDLGLGVSIGFRRFGSNELHSFLL